jgi:RNA polymerase sigma-70 factor (ECF subfamily)
VRSIFNIVWRRRALAGDPEAVATLTDEVLTPLYHFCLYRVGRDTHLCEEVVQETLVRALRDLGNYDPKRCADNIFPWLTGLARNEITRVLAREKHTVSLDRLWGNVDRELSALFARIEAEPFNDEVLRREETRELVNVTMSQLPPHYREALEAKYVNGRSVRDLAESLQQTEKGVESLLTRARKAFRATFVALNGTLETQLS